MKHLLSLTLAAALAGAALATPAQAQYAEGPPLSGRQVMEILTRRGFEPLTGARFNGDAYVVDAISPRGGAVRLVVDAFDGQVIRRVSLEGGSLDTRGYEPPPPWVRRYERDDEIAPAQPAPRQPRPAPSVRVEPPVAAPPAAAPAPVERPVAVAPPPAPARPPARAVPPAPTPTVKAPDPQPERPAASAAPQGTRSGSVRVIQGVTPVLPRSQRGVDEVGVPAPDAPGELKID